MSGTQPVAVYAMKVPCGDVMVPAVPDFAAMFRLSMAAIDPSAEPEFEVGDEKKQPRATLKIVRVPGELLDDESDESDLDELEDDEDEDEESSDGEEANGGPSDPSKAKKPSKLDLVKAIAEADSEDEDEDESDDLEEEAAAKDALMKILKGKAKATGDGDKDDEEDDDFDGLELEEIVVCTLDPEKHYQQPLDIVVGENEKVFFKVTGTHEVHLTGNYVIPVDDGQAQLYGDDDEDDYDLSPDEDELDALEDMEDDEESDELDDMDDPRVMEVDTDEEAPKLANTTAKGKNKRPAEDSDEEDANLDDIMAKSIKPSESTTNGEEKPLTKGQKKKLKKLKKNDGEAAPADVTSEKSASKDGKKSDEAAKKDAVTNGEKKVQFAKNLEQGPTPSATPPSKESGKETKSSGSLGVKVVQGVTVDDRKLGKGPQAKKGSHVEMRYIGKLEDGKVFDANKKGKPFSFKLGAGEVIKGWDIGVMGMAVGGERRLTIPANLGYGSKGAPPKIPPNSKLIFDLKVLGVK